MLKTEELKLVSEWDKTFPQSEKVDHKKVTFVNRYGITLAADLYKPKNASGKCPAIAVSGPFGAVKEQCSGLYAQTMAEKGYLTIAFDPSFTGESGGNPRYMASPDINTEDFMAAVDFLSVREDVDPDKKLLYIFDLKTGFLQTFNNAKSFQFIIAEITDVSLTFQIREKAFLVIIP